MVTLRNDSGSNGRNRLLAALSPADFSLLAPNLKDIPLTPLGDVLQEAGEAIKYVYFPQFGMISSWPLCKTEVQSRRPPSAARELRGRCRA